MAWVCFHFLLDTCKQQYGSGKNTTLMKATLSDVAVVCTTNQICAGRGELASRDTNVELEEPQEIQCYKAEATIEPQINTNIESFLLVFSFVFVNCFVPRDHRQINFVMLNRLILLRKTSHPLFLMDNIKLDGIPSKIK